MFGSVFAAAADARSLEHAAAVRRASVWEVETIAEATAGWTEPEPLDILDTPHPAILEPTGPRMLWDAGIHPGRIGALRRMIRAGEDPLPASAYIELAYTRLGPQRIHRIMRHTGSIAATVDVLRLGGRCLPGYMKELSRP